MKGYQWKTKKFLFYVTWCAQWLKKIYMVYVSVYKTLKFKIDTTVLIKTLVFENLRENDCFYKKIILQKI